MKHLAIVILACVSAVGCSRNKEKTLCGCTSKVTIPLQYQTATIKGEKLTFEYVIPTATGTVIRNITAQICNPDALQQTNLDPSKSRVVFTGEYFNSCENEKQVLVHLYDIVPAPLGFDELSARADRK